LVYDFYVGVFLLKVILFVLNVYMSVKFLLMDVLGLVVFSILFISVYALFLLEVEVKLKVITYVFQSIERAL